MNPHAAEFKPSLFVDLTESAEVFVGTPPGLDAPPGLECPEVPDVSFDDEIGPPPGLLPLPPPGLSSSKATLSKEQLLDETQRLEAENARLKNMQLELESARLARQNAELRALLATRSMAKSKAGPPGQWSTEPWMVSPWMQLHAYGLQSACSEGSTDEGLTSEGSLSADEDAEEIEDAEDVHDADGGGNEPEPRESPAE